MAYTKTKTAPSHEKILSEARKCFDRAQQAEAQQREREREDLRFQVPEEQWTDEARKERAGRPILSVPKLAQPVRLIVNQMRSADLAIHVDPISEDATDENAETIQGLMRAIERDSRAELVRAWAFDRAVKCGRGVYRVLTTYDDQGGDAKDQKIIIRRILQQGGVYFDPAAQEPDFSDAKWAFVCSWMSREQFEAEYPDATGDYGNGDDWEDAMTQSPGWVRTDEGDILVAEFWRRECIKANVKAADGEMVPRETYRVTCYHLTGLEVLKEQPWVGKYIPLVPVFGVELQPYDQERRWVGIIRDGRDGQRLFNYAVSTVVERVAMEPKAPWVAEETQIEGYEQDYRDANRRNIPVLKYKSKTVDGRPLPPPQRAQIDQSGMSMGMALVQEADSLIQTATATFEPSLGKLPTKDRSGIAIERLQQAADAGSSNFIQDLADVSMTCEAKIILDLIPHVYDRPGRIIRIVRGDDEKTEQVMLNKPYYIHPKTQRAVGMDQGMPPQGVMPKSIKLDTGTYAVAVNVGKNYQTRLQEGAALIGDFLSKSPETFPMLGDLFLRFQSFPGSKEMADRMAKVREQMHPGLGEGEDGSMPPEQMQAQLQAAQSQLQALQAELQAAAKALETEQAKQQATLAKAEMDNQTRLQIAEMNNQTKLQIEALVAEVAGVKLALEAAQEQRMADKDHAHEVGMAAAGGRTMRMQHDSGEEHDQERGSEETSSSAPAGGVE